MSIMVSRIREAEQMLGKENMNNQLCEKVMNYEARRSIAVVRDIKKGTKLLRSDLIWVRPGKGFPAGDEKKILGKKLSRNLKMGKIILKGDIK